MQGKPILCGRRGDNDNVTVFGAQLDLKRTFGLEKTWWQEKTTNNLWYRTQTSDMSIKKAPRS